MALIQHPNLETAFSLTMIKPHVSDSFNIKSTHKHCSSFPFKCTLSILQHFLLSIYIIVYHWYALSNSIIAEVDIFLKTDVRENFHSDAIQSPLPPCRVWGTSENIRVYTKTQHSMRRTLSATAGGWWCVVSASIIPRAAALAVSVNLRFSQPAATSVTVELLFMGWRRLLSL